jgi:uncharacterized protein (TIGR04255 family)
VGDRFHLGSSADGRALHLSEATPLTLNLPDVGLVEYEKNFITQAVCELRFPALLEYETATPVQLQKQLRKDFPVYERQEGVSIGLEIAKRETKHVFKSRKGDLVVSFKPSAIALETARYKNFPDFRMQLEVLLERSKDLLDTDFFTRVGLRYINEIPIGEGNLGDWIRPELVAPLIAGTYGKISRFFQEVRGSTTTGQYSFRHGFPRVEKAEGMLYTLDFDFFDENVPFDSVLSKVTDFNRESFRFFCWTIAPKTRQLMGRETVTKE